MSMDVNDLLGVGQSFDKLLSVIENGVGKLYEPTHLKNIAKAKAAEIKLIEAAKTDAEIDRAKQLSKLQPDVILSLSNVNIDLIERAKIRLARQEVERQSNIDNIVEQAVIALPNNVNNKPVERDWTNRFFQAAQDISDLQMQTIWGKVLAGETTKPGGFSARSLEVLRNLSTDEAQKFSMACSFATGLNQYILKIPKDDKRFIAEDSIALAQLGFNHDTFLLLVDAGLIHSGTNLGMEFPMTKMPLILMNNGRRFQVQKIESQSLDMKFVFNVVTFTEAGQQLGTLISNNFQQSYFDLLSSRYLNHGFKFSLVD